MTICNIVERNGVAMARLTINNAMRLLILILGVTLPLAFLLLPYDMQESASHAYMNICIGSMFKDNVFNSNLTYSPHLPLQLCRCFDSSAAIFKSSSSKYTSFYPHHLPAFISPQYTDSICRQLNKQQPIRLFVAIITRPNGFLKRAAIRETYLSKRGCQDQLYASHQLNCEQVWSQVRYAFFTGKDRTDNLVNERVQLESGAYGDIVQLSKVEDYADLTMKTLALLHWTTEYCKQAAFVLKLDDDTMLNLGSALRLLDKYENRTDHFLIGHVEPRGIVARDTKSSYYVPEAVFPDRTFPAYAYGCGYLMPQRTARLLFEAGRCVATLSIEDSFVAGLLRWSLNVSLIDEPCAACLRKGLDDTTRDFDIIHYQHLSRTVTMQDVWFRLINRQAKSPSSNSTEQTPSARCMRAN